MARTYYSDYVYHPTITKCTPEYPEVVVKQWKLDQVDVIGLVILIVVFLVLRKAV